MLTGFPISNTVQACHDGKQFKCAGNMRSVDKQGGKFKSSHGIVVKNRSRMQSSSCVESRKSKKRSSSISSWPNKNNIPRYKNEHTKLDTRNRCLPGLGSKLVMLPGKGVPVFARCQLSKRALGRGAELMLTLAAEILSVWCSSLTCVTWNARSVRAIADGGHWI